MTKVGTPVFELSNITLVGVALALSTLYTTEAWPRNLLFVQLTAAGFGSPPRLVEQLPAGVSKSELAYASGWLAWRVGDLAAAEFSWRVALRADLRYLSLLYGAVPYSHSLAELATTSYPNQAESWEWLADADAVNDPATALQLYQHAADLAPLNYLIWEKVGVLAEQQGYLDLAQTAAQHACDLNPLRNGSCHRAAELAYAKGEWATVIDYYVYGSYPEHVEDWVKLIRAAQDLGRTADAQHFLTQATEEIPADYELLLAQDAP